MAKSKYKTHVEPYLHLIPQWRRDGLTEEQVAKKLGINVSTLNLYKEKYPKFLEAIRAGKQELVKRLEDSLYSRAFGCVLKDTKVEKDQEGNKKVTTTTKSYPPETAALVFALKNLEPDKWQDTMRQKVDANVKISKLEDLINDED